MKHSIIFLMIIMSFQGLNAQDTIVKVNGEKIIAYVREVTPGAVHYKNFSNPGPMYTVYKSDLLYISYHDGKKEVYNNKPILTNAAEPEIALGIEGYGLTDNELYQKGLIDAYKYYSKYSAAGTGTLLTSLLLNGLFGLIPAIPCSLTPPKMKNLGYPNQQLMDNEFYYKGYMEGAHKRKSKKVWMNWAIGTVISTAIIILATSAN